MFSGEINLGKAKSTLSEVTNEPQAFVERKDKHEAVCAQKFVTNKNKTHI